MTFIEIKDKYGSHIINLGEVLFIEQCSMNLINIKIKS